MKITAYQRLGFKESQNFLIESIEDYLLGVPFFSWDDVQPITPNIDISIRLSMQGKMSLDKMSPFEYIKIEETVSQIGTYVNYFYYFVRHISRIAEHTILIEAHLDSINTFSWLVENGMTARTLVKREHGDRFFQTGMGSWPRNVHLHRKVDDVSENLSPVKYQTDKEPITSTILPLHAVSFYLIYKTVNEIKDDVSANPLDVFCCADVQLQIGHGTSDPVTLTAEMLSSSHYYYVIADDGYFSVGFPNGTSYASPNYASIYFKLDGGKIVCSAFITTQNGTLVVVSSVEGQDSITLAYAGKVYASPVYLQTLSKISANPSVLSHVGWTGDLFVMSFDGIDRSDSRLVKILKLPYAPCDLNYENGIYTFPPEWSLVSGLMKLSHAKMNKDFVNTQLDSILISNLSHYFSYTTKDAALLANRSFDDSKLSHSDFHTEKFTYDSFSLEFPLEKYQAIDAEDASYGFEFQQSNTINSNLMFEIKPYQLDNYDTQDFGNYLIASRNNEEPIFTNAFINYIRTGYNYDKKTKVLSATARWTGAAASIVGGALSAGVGAATGHPVLAATGVTMVAGGIAQLTSSITSQISDENSLQSKLAALQAEGSSVAGCDDIDLMTKYAQNKLLYIRYDVSSKMKLLLNDLFYFYGYAVNRQKTPDFSSRIWFNFVQCDPTWNSNENHAILGNYDNELRARLNDGITVFHKNLAGIRNIWDLNQIHENWEKWIVD